MIQQLFKLINYNTTNKLFILILSTLMLLIHGLSYIWIIVSFLIYLFKDLPFNWWSVIVCIVSFILGLFLWLYSMSDN